MEIGVNSELQILRDSSFTKAVSSEHILCIEQLNSGCRLAVFNPSNNALVACLDKTKGEELTHSIYSFEFRNVLGVFHSERTFLANDILAHSDLENVKVPELDAHFYFSVHTPFKNIQNKFPQIKAMPFGASLISGAIQKNRYQKGQKLYVHLAEDILYILHFSDEKLTMYSSEKLEEPNESIYYLSKAIELTSFNQLESKIYLSGDLEEKSELYTYLIDRVKFVYMNKGFRFQKSSVALSDVPKHHYFSHINLYQCV